jgi:SAM-dependent methyltransferase
VIAIDQSPRLVERAHERGVDARVGDVQELPLAAGQFDCTVAHRMLHRVPDLDRAPAERARVLRPGGRLVAATHGLRHLRELWSLVGRDRAGEPVPFFAETGDTPQRRHFVRVERRDVGGPVTFAAREDVQEGPLVAARVNAIFVAEP